MFLKHCTCCSDRKLTEQLNSSLNYEFFCDLHLRLNRLTNAEIVGDIRCELSCCLKDQKLEKLLYNYWNTYVEEPEKMVVDTAC